MTSRELVDRLTAAIEVDMRLGDDDVPRVEIVGAEAMITAFAEGVRRDALEEAALHVESRARNEKQLALSARQRGRIDDAVAHEHRQTALENVADQICALADHHATKTGTSDN
jgi:hypothetical protein